MPVKIWKLPSSTPGHLKDGLPDHVGSRRAGRREEVPSLCLKSAPSRLGV